MRTLLRSCTLAALGLLLLPGCDELDLQGELGNGEFNYQCGGPGDAACDGTHSILGFDLDREVLPVAVGGSFGLAFDDEDASIVPASGAMVSGSGGGSLRYLAAGTVDFLAINKEGEVVDFTPLSAKEPTALHLYVDATSVGTISHQPYEEFEIAAAPVAGSEVLGGGFGYTWTVQGTGVTLKDGGSDNVAIVELTSSPSGSSLTATAAGFSATVTFQ